MQRRLGEEGTSFFLLGYSDASASHRAFVRWEGMGPKLFRQRKVRSEKARRYPEVGASSE